MEAVRRPVPDGAPVREVEPPAEFLPPYPRTIDEAGIDPSTIEQILLRTMVNEGAVSGRSLSRTVCLGKEVLSPILEGMRRRSLVQHRGSGTFGDFVWELTESGRERAMDARRLCLYTGPAPVPLEQYLDAVKKQTVSRVHPGPADLDRAFRDLVIPDRVRQCIGPALASGRGLFIYGKPGNGKTSIAERITAAYGGTIWIPYTLIVDGLIINLFDPVTHRPVPTAAGAADGRHDLRWVHIQRPTVIAGGELTLEMLDVKFNEVTRVCEASLQLRANCGSLVIDDFGRQIVDPNRLLNRWIVPLERRVDFLRLPNARKLRVPFDVVLIFSTNMEPRSLVDEAFLRRIPYKVEMPDPTEAEFLRLLDGHARALRVQVPDGRLWLWLLDKWFREPQRPLRFCHPRDLLLQVVNICRFEQRTPVADQETLGRGAKLYFSGT